jgi:hypothetical protein
MSNSLSDYQVKKIIHCFCEDLAASKTASLLGINRNTINRYSNLFREAILKDSLIGNEKTSGEFELHESQRRSQAGAWQKRQGSGWKNPSVWTTET